MSDDRTRNAEDLRIKLHRMTRTELERFAASAQLALEEYRHEYQRTEAELVRLHGQFARATWDATNPDTVRTYHVHMTVGYHKDAGTEHEPVPALDGLRDVVRVSVPGTQRWHSHGGTVTVPPGTSAADVYRQRFLSICDDLNLSETERSTVTVISWNLIRNEL
jgi:hypothetical protein